MILEVLTDSRERVTYRDAETLEKLGSTYAGEQQQLRRLKDSTADDDFAPRAQLADLATAAVRDAHRSLALKQELGGMRMDFNAKVRAVLDDWINVGARGAAALAIVRCGLVETDTLMGFAIEVLILGEVGFARRLQPDLLQGVV